MNSRTPPLLGRRFQGLWKVLFVVVGVLYSVMKGANAQEQLARNQNAGLHFGRFRVHGFLGSSVKYDSNVFYSDNPETDEVVQIIPGADLSWAGSRFDFESGYRFTLRNNIEQNIQDDKQHRANIGANYKLSRTFSVHLSDNFERSSEPADEEIPERVGKWNNQARGEVRYVTPGEDLDVSLRYMNQYEKYDDDLSNLSFYNNKVSVTSRFNLASSFRFLPKSVANAGMEYGQTDWTQDPNATENNNNSKGINFTAGLTTQMTRRISLGVRGGYEVILFEGGPDSNSFNGGADFQYEWSPNSNFKLGYERSTQVSTFTNFYDEDRFTGEWKWKFARRFDMGLRFKAMLLDYSGPNGNADGTTRKDVVLQGGYNISYAFIEWGTLRLTYEYDRRDSNATNPTTAGSTADFTKHQGGIGVDLYY